MTPEVSVVVPMRNEAANVPQFYRELRSVLQRMGRPYEIIVIDDGSLDETFGRLAALQATDPSLVVIRFRRNFGQTAAFAAGFAHARGRLIVTTDGDLQNDPRRHSRHDRPRRAAGRRHRRRLAEGSEGCVLQPPACRR